MRCMAGLLDCKSWLAPVPVLASGMSTQCTSVSLLWRSHWTGQWQSTQEHKSAYETCMPVGCVVLPHTDCSTCRHLCATWPYPGAAHQLTSLVLLPAVRFVSDDHLMLEQTQQASANSSGSKSSSNGATPQGCTNGSKQPSDGKSPDLPSPGLHVPRGSILCICPMESHHDPRLYPEQPWAFNPDR